MMTIKILAFGQIGDIIGKSTFGFSLFKNTEELKAELFKLYPELVKVNYTLAVNKKTINQNTVLRENDIVALLPAFSGG